jgi:hypothetical protein
MPLLPDAEFPNPWPDQVFMAGWAPIDVGDLNGDGYREYIVGWYDYMGWGIIFMLYREKLWPPVPIAYFSTRPNLDDMKQFVPLKDMDGDGIDELANYTSSSGVAWHVKLYKGDKKMVTADKLSDVSERNIQIYPTPANERINASVTLNHGGDVLVSLFTVDGRKSATIFSGTQNEGNRMYSFDTSQLPSGNYYLVAESEGKRLQKEFVIQH